MEYVKQNIVDFIKNPIVIDIMLVCLSLFLGYYVSEHRKKKGVRDETLKLLDALIDEMAVNKVAIERS